MRTMKRTITSIIRNKMQAVIIFLIVFVLGNVLFASIAVQQSSNNVKEEMKSRISGELSVVQRDDLADWQIPYFAISGMNQLTKEMQEKYEDVKVWGNLSVHVKRNDDYSYSNEFVVIPSEEDMIGEFDNFKGNYYDESNYSGKELEIILFSNNYKIGDTFSIYLWDYRVNEDEYGKWLAQIPCGTIDFKVIGTAYGYSNFYNEDYKRNIAPIPMAYAELIQQKQEEIIAKHSKEELEEIYKLLNNKIRANFMNVFKFTLQTEGIDQIEGIESEIKGYENFSNANYVVKSSTADYRYIQGPIENLVALSNVTLWASIFLVVLILSLVSIFFVRNRKREIGILMSLGESKLRVVSQFILEIVLVSMLAVSLSMISGNKIGDVVSTGFMQMQIDTEAELKYEQENGDVVTQIDMLEAYEVSVDLNYIITIYLVSILVLIVATSIPLVYIIRLNPKQIMLD